LGYLVTHRIAPNGGGTLVNQYTLIFDILVEASGPGAASLWQVSSPANTDDGDLFWQGNNFGQGGDGYLGQNTFTAGEIAGTVGTLFTGGAPLAKAAAKGLTPIISPIYLSALLSANNWVYRLLFHHGPAHQSNLINFEVAA
jgi:hypothetical protein